MRVKLYIQSSFTLNSTSDTNFYALFMNEINHYFLSFLIICLLINFSTGLFLFFYIHFRFTLTSCPNKNNDKNKQRKIYLHSTHSILLLFLFITGLASLIKYKQ